MANFHSEFYLGDIVEDRYTGYIGTITAVDFRIGVSVNYELTRLLPDGTLAKEWFDEKRLGYPAPLNGSFRLSR